MAIKQKSLLGVAAKRTAGRGGAESPPPEPAKPAGSAKLIAAKKLVVAKQATAKLSTAKLIAIKRLS